MKKDEECNEMKKIIVMILVLSLILSLPLPAIAAPILSDENGFCANTEDFFSQLADTLNDPGFNTSSFEYSVQIVKGGKVIPETRNLYFDIKYYSAPSPIMINAYWNLTEKMTADDESFNMISVTSDTSTKSGTIACIITEVAIVYLTNPNVHSFDEALNFIATNFTKKENDWVQVGALEYSYTELDNTNIFGVREIAAYMEKIGVGDSGSKVKEIQKRLIELGYLGSGGADGSYGNGTASAVKAFQKKANLPETGIVDGNTYTKMMAESAPKK